MRRIWVFTLLGAVFTLCSPVSSASAASLFYRFELFSIPGEGQLHARDINDENVVVGGVQTPVFLSHPSGFVRNAGETTLIDVPGADLLNGTEATGINNSGQIVGRYVEFEAMIHGFLLEDGVFTQIDAPGSLDTDLSGINNQGDMVGHAWFNGVDGRTAFILKNGEFTFMPPGPGSLGFGISAIGINDLGNVVGRVGTPGGLNAFAIINGTYTSFSFLGQEIEAWGINNQNQIVGGLGGSVHSHGFLMDSSGLYQIDVPGADTFGTILMGINEAGILVGRVDVVDFPSFVGLVATPCVEGSQDCMEVPRIGDPLIDLPEPEPAILLTAVVGRFLLRRRGAGNLGKQH